MCDCEFSFDFGAIIVVVATKVVVVAGVYVTVIAA